MAPRASWKGYLKLAEVACPVALYTATSTADRIAFHTINRATGHRVHREYVDGETGDVVGREEQVKGYEIAPGDYIVLEPEEVAAATPESDKTLAIEAFVEWDAIDDVYFDKPYYLAPSGPHAEQAYALIRQGMTANKVAALARTVLFRRVRTLLIRPYGEGLVATTLNFDYEVRPAEAAFEDVPQIKIVAEMKKLAEHIIATKKGVFDPTQFEDRYEAALAAVVKAKQEGSTLPVRAAPKKTAPSELLEALRASAGADGARRAAPAKKARAPARKPGAAARKAG